MFPIALVAGGLIDSISDGLGHSTLTTAFVLTSVALIVHPPRASAPPLRAAGRLTDKPPMWLHTRVPAFAVSGGGSDVRATEGRFRHLSGGR